MKQYFRNLWMQLVEARKSWGLKQRQAIQCRIENAITEMPGRSVPEICRATGVRQMFLYRHFPALYKRIAADFIARRDVETHSESRNVRPFVVMSVGR